MRKNPLSTIKEELKDHLPSALIDKLPKRWEKIGDVLIIKLSKELKAYREIIGKTYANVLDCKSVLNDVGGIKGEMREPDLEFVYGSKDTETIHIENGVKFKLDPMKVMFSSGNMKERIRIATVSNEKETVVDLFSGIGYFSLPIAVHSRPRRIYACEKNKIAFDYLIQNISLNNVNSIIEPLFGDNREVAPENVADRVIMGYIGGTEKFLPTAIRCLKNGIGFIHFHERYPEEIVPKEPLKSFQKIADEFNRRIELKKCMIVKSYAPGINHYVFDILVGEK